VRSIAELRAALDAERNAGKQVGLVPTMGAFHDGHLSLMRRARQECDVAVVSLFVNPAQFTDSADLAAYPRDDARDERLASGEGVHLLFIPTVDEIYPRGFATHVEVSGVTEPLEGLTRGTAHFRGVATVVTKLLNIVQPDVAYFGQKDAQQVSCATWTWGYASKSARRCAKRMGWRCRAATFACRRGRVRARLG
jgi:pantoate--beta-alanine ligase